MILEAACQLVPSVGAAVQRESAALESGDADRWNPFKAAADAVKAQWNPIDKMRGELCWDREDMLEHEECMEWMVGKCKDSNGKSKRCQKLRDHVYKHCMNGRQLACDYAKQLNMDITPPVPPAPAPAPVAAPAPSSPGPAAAPAKEEAAPAPAEAKKAPAPAPAKEAAAGNGPKQGLNAEGGVDGGEKPAKLQSQGFEGKKVRHVDGKTYSSDWGDEYEHASTTEQPAAHSSAMTLQMVGVTSMAIIAVTIC